MKKILVTGGNSGIGFALCKRLVAEGCYVYLGSRDKTRGEAAVREINSPDTCELVVIDVQSEESVKNAVEKISPVELYAVVNNAGIGLGQPGVENFIDQIVDVNYFGAKRVTDAFLPLIQKDGGRIANTSSGAASGYVSGKMMGQKIGVCSAVQKMPLMDPNVTFQQIEDIISIESKAGYQKQDAEGANLMNKNFGAYCLSKACLTAGAMVYARANPNLIVTSCTPGFIKTKMTEKFGEGLPVEKGIISLMHCLFGDVTSGYYYGSDALRSPLHEGRDPGTPEYDGEEGAPGDGWDMSS
jgi:carbonyl reductase 1